MEVKDLNTMKQRNVSKRLGVWIVVIAAVLMIPFFAKAPWSMGDYVFAAVVLFVLAAGYEFATRNMKNFRHRVGVGVIVLFIIFLIMGWAASGP